ncbi:MAG: hypothetical protein QNJ13_07890 [Paracoccaceae bacterium]|nr:hypothetical protein [Paracoccaceae bacterium]
MNDDDPLSRAEELLRDEQRRRKAKETAAESSPLAAIDRAVGTGSILWRRYLRRVWALFSWPVRKYWSLCKRLFHAFAKDADGRYSKPRGAATIFALALFTVFFGFHLIVNAIPMAARFTYDALAINLLADADVLVFSQPNSVEGRPGELVVYACRRYPCEAQFDSVEFRIRDSIYLDVVSYIRYFQPHYPGELAGAFVSEENGCKVRFYGKRIKFLGFYPQITHAVCQPINGANAEAVLAAVADVELR